MITRGVASVPSPVTNLCEYNENITPRQFTEAVVNAFKTHFKLKQPVRNNLSMSHSRILIRQVQASSVSFDKSAMRTNSIRGGILELGVSAFLCKWPKRTLSCSATVMGLDVRSNARVHIHFIEGVRLGYRCMSPLFIVIMTTTPRNIC